MAKLVNTDNFNGDYPDEKFITGIPAMPEECLRRVAEAINDGLGAHHPRYIRVVDDDYQLQPGFEP